MKLIEVTDEYIKYMKNYFFKTMLDNKEGSRKHGRKYLGVILLINDYRYFAPLSSPKQSDYDLDGSIKKSTSSVLRIVKDYSTNPKLLGTIKLNNMLPIPENAIIIYDLANESDLKYKNLVIDEQDWIQQNTTKINKAAKKIYYFKIHEVNNKNGKNDKYLESIMPFKEAEKKCDEYQL